MNFARGIADAISKKQYLDPSDVNRILNFVEAVKVGPTHQNENDAASAAEFSF